MPSARISACPRVFLCAAAALGLAGALLLGRGLWIPAKAALAQVLLERAWDETRASAGRRPARPWAWADSWPAARLRVPRLKVERVILTGATGSTLAFAPGHVDGTAAPGAAGNTVLAGHRDTSFAFLRRLEPGDLLYLESAGGAEASYRVRDLWVVDAARGDLLAPTGESLLTLVTCWPFDALAPGGRERFVVRAVRTSEVTWRQP